MGRSWDYYNEIAHLYDSQYEEPYWKLYHMITQWLIERQIRKSDLIAPLNVLDLGSGTGLWMEFFVERGDRVTCLEPSKNMIEIIQIKAEALEKTISIIEGISEKIPTENELFDIVNAQGDIFSYSINPKESINEAFRVLKPGGLLVGSVDNLYA
ncbi:MAG: class I SAM-dependent methyltransferase, partial [Thermotogota bacterium]